MFLWLDSPLGPFVILDTSYFHYHAPLPSESRGITEILLCEIQLDKNAYSQSDIATFVRKKMAMDFRWIF